MTVKPIYGTRNSLKSFEKESYQSCILKEAILEELIFSMKQIFMSSVGVLEKHLKGNPQCKAEKQCENYLEWSVLRNGLYVLNINDFLVEKYQNYYLKKELLNEDVQDYDCQSKGESLEKSEEDCIANLKREYNQLFIKKKEKGEIKNKVNLEKEEWTVKDNFVGKFLEEIKKEEGFIWELVQKVAKQISYPAVYMGVKMTPTFKNKYMKYWQKAEAFILLSGFYHIGLLNNIEELKLKENHFKEQTAAIGKMRNQIFGWMLREAQDEKEWHFALEGVLEKRNEYCRGEEKDIIKEDVAEEEENEVVKEEKEVVKEGKKIKLINKKKKKKEKKKIIKKKEQEVEEKVEEKKKDEKSVKVEEKMVEEEIKFNYVDKNKFSDLKRLKKILVSQDCEKAMREKFEKRYIGNTGAIETLCQFKKVNYNIEDTQETLGNLFAMAVQEIYEQNPDEKDGQLVCEMQSPYERVSKHVISRCYFLLTLVPSYVDRGVDSKALFLQTKALDDEEEIESENENKARVIGISSRSLSCPVDDEHLSVDKEKLETFRSWVREYKKWREWTEAQNSEDEERFLKDEKCSPLTVISKFVCTKVSLSFIEEAMHTQVRRCAKRIAGLQMLLNLENACQDSILEKYLDGILSLHFGHGEISKNISSASVSFEIALGQICLKYMKHKLESFIKLASQADHFQFSHFNKIAEKMRKNLGKIGNKEFIVEEWLKQVQNLLTDLSVLLFSQITSRVGVWSSKGLVDSNLMKEFFVSLLKISVFFKTFGYLSNNLDKFRFLSKSISEISLLIFTKSWDKISDSNLLNSLIKTALSLLKTEIGIYQEKKVNVRILGRIQDVSAQQRIKFLLLILWDCLQSSKASVVAGSIKEEAQILFMLTYFTEVPLFVNFTLKILKVCGKLFDLTQVPSIFGYEYHMIEAENYEDLVKNLKKEEALRTIVCPVLKLKQFTPNKLEQSASNFDLLVEKLGSCVWPKKDSDIFRFSLEKEWSKLKEDDSQNYAIVVHLNNEEDTTFLVKVLYHWERLFPSFTTKMPKTVEEYFQYKELKKKETEEKNKKKSSQAVNLNQIKFGKGFEALFVNMPEINLISSEEEESKLPFGWEFSYLPHIYEDMRTMKIELAKAPLKKNSNKKHWANVNLAKLEKKFDELNRTFEEFKPEMKEEEKLENIRVKNYISEMLIHLRKVRAATYTLEETGFYSYILPGHRTYQFAYVLQLGIDGLLAPITLDSITNNVDLKKRLEIEPILALKKEKSNMIVSFYQQNVFHQFEFALDWQNNLNLNSSQPAFFVDSNKIPVLHQAVRSGLSTQSLISELVDFLRTTVSQKILCNFEENANKALKSLSEDFEKNEQFQKMFYFGILTVLGGWSNIICPGAKAKIKGSGDEEKSGISVVINGGSFSGSKSLSLISKRDATMTMQTLLPTQIELQRQEIDVEIKIELTLLLNAICSILKQFSFEESNKNKTFSLEEERKILENGMIIKILIQVANRLHWFTSLQNELLDKNKIKELIDTLLEFSKYCPSDNDKMYYETEFVEAWARVVDRLEPAQNLIAFPKVKINLIIRFSNVQV